MATPAPPPSPSARTAVSPPPPRARRRPSPLALAALAVAALAGLLAAVAGAGTRWGVWPFPTGFGLLRDAFFGALLALALAVGAVLRTWPGKGRRGLALAVLALLLALLETAVPLAFALRARRAPAIHDISTDTANPPPFVAVVPRRAGAANPVEYGGPLVAAQQREAYPDIQPLLLDLDAARAFQRALDVVREMGWELVAADPQHGRIEATDRTFWFGFRDDVVVRVTAAGARSVVDVRSLSRVGRGDTGTNARRIRKFLHAMQR